MIHPYLDLAVPPRPLRPPGGLLAALNLATEPDEFLDAPEPPDEFFDAPEPPDEFLDAPFAPYMFPNNPHPLPEPAPTPAPANPPTPAEDLTNRNLDGLVREVSLVAQVWLLETTGRLTLTERQRRDLAERARQNPLPNGQSFLDRYAADYRPRMSWLGRVCIVLCRWLYISSAIDRALTLYAERGIQKLRELHTTGIDPQGTLLTHFFQFLHQYLEQCEVITRAYGQNPPPGVPLSQFRDIKIQEWLTANFPARATLEQIAQRLLRHLYTPIIFRPGNGIVARIQNFVLQRLAHWALQRSLPRILLAGLEKLRASTSTQTTSFSYSVLGALQRQLHAFLEEIVSQPFKGPNATAQHGATPALTHVISLLARLQPLFGCSTSAEVTACPNSQSSLTEATCQKIAAQILSSLQLIDQGVLEALLRSSLESLQEAITAPPQTQISGEILEEQRRHLLDTVAHIAGFLTRRAIDHQLMTLTPETYRWIQGRWADFSMEFILFCQAILDSNLGQDPREMLLQLALLEKKLEALRASFAPLISTETLDTLQPNLKELSTHLQSFLAKKREEEALSAVVELYTSIFNSRDQGLQIVLGTLQSVRQELERLQIQDPELQAALARLQEYQNQMVQTETKIRAVEELRGNLRALFGPRHAWTLPTIPQLIAIIADQLHTLQAPEEVVAACRTLTRGVGSQNTREAQTVLNFLYNHLAALLQNKEAITQNAEYWIQRDLIRYIEAAIPHFQGQLALAKSASNSDQRLVRTIATNSQQNIPRDPPPNNTSRQHTTTATTAVATLAVGYIAPWAAWAVPGVLRIGTNQGPYIATMGLRALRNTSPWPAAAAVAAAATALTTPLGPFVVVGAAVAAANHAHSAPEGVSQTVGEFTRGELQALLATLRNLNPVSPVTHLALRVLVSQ